MRTVNDIDYPDPALTARAWVRSDHGVIAGVCEQIGINFNIDPWIVRILWVLSVLFAGTGLVLYAVAWFTLPRESEATMAMRPRILGVCPRVADRLNMEVGLVRLLAILLCFVSLGAAFIGYIVLHILLPQEGV